MLGEAGVGGAGDRTRTVLQLAPPAARHQPGQGWTETDRVHWMKRFLNGEYDRWISTKRQLKVEEDYVIVRVLLDFFQLHGGFNWYTSNNSGSLASCPSLKRDVPSTGRSAEESDSPRTNRSLGRDEATPIDRSTEQDDHFSAEDNGCDSRLSEPDDPDEPPPPKERSLVNGRLTRLQNSRRQETLIKARSPPRPPAVLSAEVSEERPPPDLPPVDGQLMPLFCCGLCGAGDFPSLAAHLEHLWSAHTELRMLGSAQRRRVPLKLRPHMFVLCALCGLNNRSTSTAGAADRHLTRAHLPARHRRALAAAAAGPSRYVCDDCEMECPSRAELAVHVLDAGHGCAGFVCELCGEEGEGEANAAHHRLWHNAVLPFQCYLCAERFAAEPECVVHIRTEHAASFNIHRCARCPYATSTVGQFVAHARSHVGLNTCVCHECGVTFQTTQSLRRHLMTHARSEFRCRHCGKTFRHPLPLERHERSQHDRPEDHKCSTCGKLFSSRYHLERHSLIHSGRRPHQCDRCGRGFVQKGDLARHVRKCRVGELGEPLALQPPLKVAVVPAVCPPPPLAPPPPPMAPPMTVLAPMPPPPPQQQSVLLHVASSPMVMPLPAQGAG